MTTSSSIPVLALTQGDAAGVGPELLVKHARDRVGGYHLVYVAERAALEGAKEFVAASDEVRFAYRETPPSRPDVLAWDESEGVLVYDPVASDRVVGWGESGADDARAAIACLEAGVELARTGAADAVVTAPVSKYSIATHCQPEFRGQTEFVAALTGAERYGRDFLMTFLAAELQVALLTTHQPLADVVNGLSGEVIEDAVRCLHRNAGGRIAVAGLNPHAGEGGLMGREEEAVIAPALARCRESGIDIHGPESADSLFARARRGEFDWVLALYHDQGLIPIKTVAFGTAANWTLGLPIIRTSVDHGTAFDIAGRGKADARPLRRVVEMTRELIAQRLPRRRGAGAAA